MRQSRTFVPIWFPHCPAWMWTISLIALLLPVSRCSVGAPLLEEAVKRERAAGFISSSVDARSRDHALRGHTRVHSVPLRTVQLHVFMLVIDYWWSHTQREADADKVPDSNWFYLMPIEVWCSPSSPHYKDVYSEASACLPEDYGCGKCCKQLPWCVCGGWTRGILV